MYNKLFFEVALEENIVNAIKKSHKKDRPYIWEIVSGLSATKKARIKYLLIKKNDLTLV